MKLKSVLLMVLLTTAPTVYAEDIIQAVPLTTKAGVVADDAAFLTFTMNNSSASILGYEFKVKLPDGMTFEDSDPVEYPPFELVYDRYPYTGRNKVYDHSVDYAKKSDGWWHIFVSSNKLNPIKEDHGEILRGYFVTDASMQPGIYPIIIKECVMGISGSQGIEPPTSISYVVISEDGQTSLLRTLQDVDLSNWDGYIPSFVMEAVNADLAENESLRSVNLSKATELGAELEVPENVVYITASEVGFKRTFPAGQWSTVCLPFALDDGLVSTITGMGCEIMQLTGYSDSERSVSFEQVTSMAANTPYLVKSETSQSPFEAIEGVTVGDMSSTNNVEQGKMSMVGTFEKKIISSDANTTYYAYDAADGKFVRIGSNATVRPFRAYMALSGVSNAATLALDTDGKGTTDINTIDNKHFIMNNVYYDLGGRCFETMTSSNSELHQGVFIKNGKKYVVK